MTPKLYQLEWICPLSNAEAFSDELLALGAFSASVTDVSETEARIEAVSGTDTLAALLELAPTHHHLIENSDWENRWLDDYVGTTLCHQMIALRPAQEEVPAFQPNTIWIDPRSAFGDGLHPTTQLCADAIYDHIQLNHPSTMLDLGCGTGILSLIAAHLGIQNIIAIDYDPAAVSSTLRNFQLNQISIAPIDADVTNWAPEMPAPLIVANLQTHILLRIVPRLKSWLTPGGHFILSGVHSQWKEEILDACHMAGLPIDSTIDKDDWIMLSGSI
jgi:ribosomal protein L11 methyltransferase